jgi:hypothetical protein
VASTFFITRTIFSSSLISTGLVLQAAGGVDQQHVDLLAARLGERVEGKPGCIRAGGARDQRGAAAAAQILSWSIAAARKVSPRPASPIGLRRNRGRKLADGRGLAEPLTPDHQHRRTAWLRRSRAA